MVGLRRRPPLLRDFFDGGFEVVLGSFWDHVESARQKLLSEKVQNWSARQKLLSEGPEFHPGHPNRPVIVLNRQTTANMHLCTRRSEITCLVA